MTEGHRGSARPLPGVLPGLASQGFERPGVRSDPCRYGRLTSCRARRASAWRRWAVLYRRVPGALRPRLIADAVGEADRGVIDLSGLWVARRRGRIVGALLTQPLAGRAAAVWAPEVAPSWRRAATAVALVRAALADLRAAGFRIAQALLDESAPAARRGRPHRGRHAPRDRPGLPRAEHGPPVTPPSRPPAARLGRLRARDRARVPRGLAGRRTSAASTCPSWRGSARSTTSSPSHRAGGRFVPGRWRLGRVRGEPEAGAVVLLSEIPDRDAWEVAYLGLTPAARGRGLGRAALAHALELAAPHVPRLELAVDLRNTPANRLYQARG